MKIRRLIVFFIFLLISTVSYSQVIRGYKVQREYGTDTIVGYEARNLDLTGYAGTAFVVGDTAYIYYNGKVMKFVAPRYLFPGITSYTSNEFLVLKGDTLYKRSIASLGGADSVYFLPGLVTSSEGYYGIGDTLKIDTSKATMPPPDTFYVVYGDVRSEGLISSGDTIFIDTAHVVLDSIYILPTTLWSGAGWLFSGDTLRVDTTGGGVDSYWQRSGERLTPAETMDSVYTAHGGMAPVIVYGSNVVSNGGFETYTGHSGGLAQFTDWLNGTTRSGYIDTAAGYVGAYSVKLSDGGTQSASIYQESRSFTAGVRYKLSFYHKGAAMVYQLYRGTTYFNASTGAWGALVSNTIPVAADWTRYDINFTAPTTASNYYLKFDQATNGSTTYIDAVQIATFAEHMAITSTYPLHFTATKYLVKSLTATTSDTALILRGDTLYKGKVTMDVPVDSLKINGTWYFSGDSLTIAIDYDSINVDSLITGALIDSIITTINIDSITQLIVIGYLDTSSAVRDTFEVVYGTTQQPGWVSSGDQIYIDTSGQVVDTFQLSGNYLEISLSEVNEVHRVFLGKYVDSLYIEYCDGCALTSGLVLSGNTIYIDTARRQDTIVSSVITSDTLYSIIINVDSIYLENDTIVDYIWRPGDGGYVNAKLKASTSYITGNHTVVLGFNDSVVANYGFSAGAYNKVSGAAGVAIGFMTEAGGETSFAGGRGYFSVNQRVRATGNAAFNFSRIVGAGEQSNASGDQSAVLGGKNNSATGEGTVVVGGDGIVGTRNYTTYVNDLYTKGEIYLSDTSYIDEVGGMLAIVSKNGFIIGTDTSALIYDIKSFRPFANFMNIDIGKDSPYGFNNGYFEGTVYADKLQVSDNAAEGRVMICQNPEGLGKWEPLSELTGTADTFYLPGEGWLQSGDTIALPVVDSSKWSRSTGRLVSKHVGDTVGVGDKGHLVPYGAAGEVLIDFEDFVGYTDTLDLVQPYLPSNIAAKFAFFDGINTTGELGIYADYDIDTTTGVTGIGVKLTNSYPSIESQFYFYIEVRYVDQNKNPSMNTSLMYKGDGLNVAILGPYGYFYDFTDSTWKDCDGYNWIFNNYSAKTEWTEISLHYPSMASCNQMGGTVMLLFAPPDSMGASVSIDDIRVSYVDSGMNIVSEGSLHITPSEDLYIHNLPFATTDTLLGIDGNRVYKTTVTLPDVDSSKWSRSTGRLMSKHVGDTVGVGDKGHLVPYGAAGEVLIDFEDFVGYTDTIDNVPPSNLSALFELTPMEIDLYEDYDIDTTSGLLGSTALKITNSTINTTYVFLYITSPELPYEKDFEISFNYKGDGLNYLIWDYNGCVWDSVEWKDCTAYNYYWNYVESSSEWVKITIKKEKGSYISPSYIGPFMFSFTTIDSIGASVSIDDIRVSYVDSGMNIVSEGSLHITPSEDLYIHNLPFATTDTLLGLDGDRVVKTAITIPVSADSSKWQVSGTTLAPKDSTLSVSIGKKTAGYPLDVNGAGMFNGRTYWQSTKVFAQNDGTNGLYLAGYNDIKFAIGGSTKYTATTTYFRPSANNTVDLGQTSNRWKNVYAGTKIFTPKLQLSSLSTNTTSTDVLVLNGTEVEKRGNIGLWYKGLGTESKVQDISGGWYTQSGNYSVSMGRGCVASGTSSLAGGGNSLSNNNYASGAGAFSWQSAMTSASVSGDYSVGFGTGNVIGGDNSVAIGFGNYVADTAEYSAAIASLNSDALHEGAAMISTQYRSSEAEWTLHTDNLHVFKTATIGEVLTLTSIADLPTSPISGMLVNHAGVLKFYNGSTWKTISFD